MLSILKKIYFIFIKYKFLIMYPNLKIGLRFKCGPYCSISKKNIIKIGNDFFMGRNCHLASNLTIGNDVMCGSYVAFVGGDHKIDNISVPMNKSGRDTLKTTEVSDNVWIGNGSIILHGVKLSTGCVIAAGSVVTKDVESNAIYGGNPAKFIRYRKNETDHTIV